MSKFSGINAALGETPGPLRVLVAPLDWGLGHATRCVPVICALQAAGHQVWLAGEGAQEQLLRGIFPGLPFLPLKGYRVRYGRSALGTTLKLITQLPRLRKTIREENRWLAEMQQQYQFQLIISDNRFGLHHPAARCATTSSGLVQDLVRRGCEYLWPCLTKPSCTKSSCLLPRGSRASQRFS